MSVIGVVASGSGIVTVAVPGSVTEIGIAVGTVANRQVQPASPQPAPMVVTISGAVNVAPTTTVVSTMGTVTVMDVSTLRGTETMTGVLRPQITLSPQVGSRFSNGFGFPKAVIAAASTTKKELVFIVKVSAK